MHTYLEEALGGYIKKLLEEDMILNIRPFRGILGTFKGTYRV